MTDDKRRAMASTVEFLAEAARDAARRLKVCDDPEAWRQFELSARSLKRMLEVPLAARQVKEPGRLL